MTVGERIKTRRESLGISADDLALVIGKSRATIYRYENGDILTMKHDILPVLASALETTPGYLMGWTDDPYDYDKDPNSLISEIPVSWVRHWQDEGLSLKEMWDRYVSMSADTDSEEGAPRGSDSANTQDERFLLHSYRTMTDQQRQMMSVFLKGLMSNND